MRILNDAELAHAKPFIAESLDEAKKATCLRAKCGAVIVADERVIGRGYNSPPGDLESQRRCLRRGEIGPGFKSDKTCCVHAEQRAIVDATRSNGSLLNQSTMYFSRLTTKGDVEVTEPYCTICSKMTLDAGIKFMVLLEAQGWIIYETADYNDQSFAYGRDSHGGAGD
jgi:deoxycytidylate deaminase